jgi:hypothetical protein
MKINRVLILLCIALCLPRTAEAGEHGPADSLRKSPYKFRATQLIAPAALVGLGVTGLTVNPVKEFNRKVSSAFAGNRQLSFDDYLQYAPLATPYVLKLCGVESRHNYGEYTVLLAVSSMSMAIMVNVLKYTVKELRPNGISRNSFPSGHTATAFMGAELLRTEFWEVSPWIGVGGYLVASSVGFMRCWRNRHWVTDVLAGAGIGILSARIAYWVFPPLQRLFFGVKKRGVSGVHMTLAPYYDGRRLGGAAGICF